MKIGDELYRCLFTGAGTALWRYEVIEVRQSKETELYVLLCHACTHGYKCEVLASEVRKGVYSYVGMVNEDEDGSQDYWHKSFALESMYFTTKAAARKNYGGKALDEYREKLKESVATTKRLTKCIADLQLWVDRKGES